MLPLVLAVDKFHVVSEPRGKRGSRPEHTNTHTARPTLSSNEFRQSPNTLHAQEALRQVDARRLNGNRRLVCIVTANLLNGAVPATLKNVCRLLDRTGGFAGGAHLIEPLFMCFVPCGKRLAPEFGAPAVGDGSLDITPAALVARPDAEANLDGVTRPFVRPIATDSIWREPSREAFAGDRMRTLAWPGVTAAVNDVGRLRRRIGHELGCVTDGIQQQGLVGEDQALSGAVAPGPLVNYSKVHGVDAESVGDLIGRVA